MPRPAPCIRDAEPEDAAELLELWAAMTGIGAHPAHARTLTDAQQALATIALDADQRLLVAEVDDRIVAAMKLDRGPLWPLALEQAVHSSFLMVLPACRRHGYGHALVEAALAWAEEKDISHLTVLTDGDRDTNRFFARLGLSTSGTVRHASAVALRKKFSAQRGRAAGNRHLVDVLAQRRSMRRRTTDG